MSSSDEGFVVDRCVCADVAFAELVRLRREEGLSLDMLRKRTGCCVACRMCEGYVRLALATGRSRFPLLDDDEIADAMRLPV